MAVAYQALGDIDKARVYFEQALKIGEESGVPSLADFTRANSAAFLIESGEPARAGSLLLQALPGSSAAYLSVRHLQIGFARFVSRPPRRGAGGEQQSARHVSREHAGSMHEIAVVARAGRAAHGRSRAGRARRRRTCFEELERMRDKLPASDFLRQGFQSLWQFAYSLAIDLAFSDGRAREALATAELGRSRALVDLLASRDLETGTRPTAGLTFRSGDNGVKSASIGTASSVDDLQAAAPTAQVDDRSLLGRARQDLLVGRAPDGTVNGAVTPVAHQRLDALVQAIALFGPGSRRTLCDDAWRTGRVDRPSCVLCLSDLYGLLIRPVERYPAERQWRGGDNRAVLRAAPQRPVRGVARRSRTYLVERYAARYGAGHCDVDVHRRRRARQSPRRPRAARGRLRRRHPRLRGEPPFPRLPGAEAEVRAIAAILPPGRATTLDADAATEPRVLAAAPHQAVIHFATHAIINDTNPLASFLALGRPADGSSSGQLTAEKIYRLKLDADLVVLSACRSGGGNRNGDGIATLARSFFYAGANSLVVSVWDVADEPTNRLLAGLLRGVDSWRRQGAGASHGPTEIDRRLARRPREDRDGRRRSGRARKPGVLGRVHSRRQSELTSAAARP